MAGQDEIYRRQFLSRMAALSAGVVVAGCATGETDPAQPSNNKAVQAETPRPWQPVSDRKLRMGIVGYGECLFGAAFGFQDHPNVEIVAVSDLVRERREGLMKACRCDKSYESLEKLVLDKNLEAVFVATDAPSHARHCMDVLRHGKHVLTAVPAVFGSVEQAQQLLEVVKQAQLNYMMAETSWYRGDCYAMRQIYKAGGFGRLVFSEGEYYHYRQTPIPSFRGWRTGMPPLWYPTHSTAYYVGVSAGRLTSVSCLGSNAGFDAYKPGANKYGNQFTDEIALYETSEGGSSRMLMCKGVCDLGAERGRVFGEKGYMDSLHYRGQMKQPVNILRPALAPGVPKGGHGGSHGYIAEEFIRSILQQRQPEVNIYQALALTVPGVIAHESALRDGERLKIPQFD